MTFEYLTTPETRLLPSLFRNIHAYLVIISAGFGLDAGLALTNSQYNVHSCFGILSVVFSAG